MIDRGDLAAAGLSSEQADRAWRALDAGDLRGFVHELLLHGFWTEVVDETPSRPQWIERWRDLASNGFPIIDSAALDRLEGAGVDLDDLTGVVRSAQILALYNVAQLLDYPSMALGWNLPDAATPHLACATETDGSSAQRLLPLHPDLLRRDPSGRFGEPLPLPLRQWQMLAQGDREELKRLIRSGHRSQAAALWKRLIGGELRACIEAVDILRAHFGEAEGE